jgi:hypothetical protein
LQLSSCGPSLSEQIQKQRQDYVNNNIELDKMVKDAILQGRVCNGMTSEQVVVATGYRPTQALILNFGEASTGYAPRQGIQYGRYTVFFGPDNRVVDYKER